ncbi:hypothetical protein [Nonomuraea sp. NPDC049480]|uniref:hypothetical protein n=1 Tax=Nonomuraea sp. NPDC049480 TaxID=3364353 RepID=UPI0037B5CAAE
MSRRARRLVPHALLASTLALTWIPFSAVPALTAVQEAPNLVLHCDFEGDLSDGTVADRSASGLNGTLANPGRSR